MERDEIDEYGEGERENRGAVVTTVTYIEYGSEARIPAKFEEKATDFFAPISPLIAFSNLDKFDEYKIHILLQKIKAARLTGDVDDLLESSIDMLHISQISKGREGFWIQQHNTRREISMVKELEEKGEKESKKRSWFSLFGRRD